MALKQSNYNCFLKFFLFLIFLFVFNNCSEDKPTEPNEEIPTSGNLSIGETVLELTEDIGSGGGTIKIANTESKLNGMEIIIPENGSGESRTYKISSSLILEHKLGEYFDPVSPMITIENGSGYSKTPIQIKIPINKEDDTFLMGFFYDEITGELEALPIVELTNEHITVETKHFGLSSVLSETLLGKRSSLYGSGNLIISTIKEKLLMSQTIINSGFTPGVDDWEFINYGSYLSPGGHCAGQSMTAMWYFYEKKRKGEQPLFHRFDKFNDPNDPSNLWQDNPLGYRLASVVQEDANWGAWITVTNLQSKIPLLTWKTFITAMLLTNEPQLVLINNSAGMGAHAMIVYKINVPDGKLFVADPNYPNNRTQNGEVSIRTISYANGKFEPYPSFAKVGDKGILFDQIGFFAKTTHFNWSKVGERYRQLEEEKIGSDMLPSYDLLVESNDEDVPFIDGMTIYADNLTFYCQNKNIPQYLSNTDHLQLLKVFNYDGRFLGSTDENGIFNFSLEPNKYEFGIAVYGQKLTDNKLVNHYYDFKWITFDLQRPSVDNSLTAYNKASFRVKINTEETKVNDVDGTVEYESTLEHTGSLRYSGSFSGTTFIGSLNLGSITDTLYGTINATLNSTRDVITDLEYQYIGKDKNETYYNNWKTTIKTFNIPFAEKADNKLIFRSTIASSICENITFLEETFETWYQNENRWVSGYSCDENSIIEVTFYKE